MTGQQPYDEDADRILAGEYALGLLSPEEARLFEARMARLPEVRALYVAWVEEFATLTDDIPAVPPAPGLKARIDADLFGTASRRRAFAGWRGIAWLVNGAAAATLLVLLAVNGGYLTSRPAAVPGYTAEIAAEDGSMLLAARYDAKAGMLSVERQKGEAPEGRVLELWLIKGDNAPVSLGVMPVQGVMHMKLAPDLRGQVTGGLLAVTDEPPGGAPGGVPTGTVMASGTVTPA